MDYFARQKRGRNKNGAAYLQVVAERPRRRKLQQLQPEAIALRYHREERKHEELPLAA
jgi:hypothetical protein